MSLETVTWGTTGNITFVNTYDTTNVDLSYIELAESTIGGLWTASSPITLTLHFVSDLSGVTTIASNEAYSYIPVSYSDLAGRLPSWDTLPPDPTFGSTWYLPEAYARMLGLSTFAPPTSSFDAQINLNTSLSGSVQVSAIEHEITEGGMGRIGGLGVKTYPTLEMNGSSQSNIWGAPDLFRYSNGAYDPNANDTTYFSANGGSTISSLAFFSGNNSRADTADFESDTTGNYGAPNDVFGGGPATFSQLDYQIMDALGWEPILPELEIKSDSLTSSTATVKAGDTISLSATINNYGATAAGAFQTQFYISASATFDYSSAIAIGNPISTSSLAAGSTVTLSETATVPNITAGTEHLFAVPDYLNQVTQLTTNNVSYSIPIAVIPAIFTINTRADLVAALTNFNLSGHYVLGADIDASAFNFAPIADFSGVLDGQGHSINNLQNTLFNKIDVSGLVENVNLENVSITSATGVGSIAFENDGSIVGCSVTGIVIGGGMTGALVGENLGTITQSYAAATVTGTAYVGGLVGNNSSSGGITQSFATGTVDGGLDVGGLVGTNQGSIAQSYATGAINTSRGTGVLIGGLAGINAGSITQSYATGLVAGGGMFLGGLVGVGGATASYWDTETSGRSESGGGTGLTTAQLQSGTLPAGFDPTIWSDVTGQFPELQWQTATPPGNHMPFASNITASANEDTNNPIVKLVASFTDADLSDTFTFSTDTTGTIGLVKNSNDGTFTYDPNGNFESLGVGETATDTFTYTVTDDHGASSTATATVTVHGENDAPIALADLATLQKGEAISVDAAHGVRANDTDPDIHDVLQVSAVNGSSSLVGQSIRGNYGTLTLFADGSYTYTARSNAPLGAQDVFQYSIADGHGASSISTLTLQIPYPSLVISSATLTGSVSERSLVTGSIATDKATPGVITYNVPDSANRPSATIDTAHQTVTWQDSTHDYTGQLTASQIAALESAFSIAQTDNAASGKVTWTYKIADATLDFLGANETITITTPILIDDHHGNTTPENVVVTINGADDKPTASPDTAAASQSGTVRVDAIHGVLSNDIDPDSHDQGHLFVSAVDGDAGEVGQTINGKYGTLTLKADGSYSYVETSSHVPASGAQDVFNYWVSDGHGGTARSTLTIDVTAGPSLVEYYNAAEAVYLDNAVGMTTGAHPPSSTGLTLLLDSRDPSLPGNSSWLADGMFAQAFEDKVGNVIIAFEGSIIKPSDPSFLTPYGFGSRGADLDILTGLTPKAFVDAQNFAFDAAQFVHQTLGSSPIYLTGHSLGGAEAQDVAFIVNPGENVSGVTFGAPGDPTLSAPVKTPNFIDYIDYGDPVGNFGNHFGTVQHVGSPLNAAVLTVAEIEALVTHGLSLAEVAGIFHPLAHYASDLGLHLHSDFVV